MHFIYKYKVSSWNIFPMFAVYFPMWTVVCSKMGVACLHVIDVFLMAWFPDIWQQYSELIGPKYQIIWTAQH